MAITILSQPEEFIPIYSIDGDNLSFVLESTESALCSMKYVVEISVNGAYITTIKNSPNLVDGKCVMTLNRVIEDFVSYDKWIGPNFQICTSSVATYSVRFGEETDGTYDCTGDDFDVAYDPTYSGRVFNGTIQYGEAFDIEDYYIGGGYIGDFLTNQPDDTGYLNVTDSSYLYYISMDTVTTGATGPFPVADQALEVLVYDEFGGITIWYVLNLNPSPPNTIIAIGVGPDNINDYVSQAIVWNSSGVIADGPIITCDTIQYKVRISTYEISS